MTSVKQGAEDMGLRTADGSRRPAGAWHANTRLDFGIRPLRNRLRGHRINSWISPPRQHWL